jgi:hypothetical protein
MPFQPGESGNPAGRPPGTRNKTAALIETMLDGEAEDIARKAIELAKQGDGAAIRLCLSRLCPPRRERAAPFEIPSMNKPADAVQAAAAIVEAVASGELTPGEGADLSKLVENFAKTLEVYDHEVRLRNLEARAKQREDGFQKTWKGPNW